MSGESIAIYWKEQLVGYIQNPEKWSYVWWGRWIPAGTEASRDFLEAFNLGRGQWVELGNGFVKEFALVEAAPRRHIELRLNANEEDTLPIHLPDSNDQGRKASV